MIFKGTYKPPRTLDIIVHIWKVMYRGPEYTVIKASLVCKRTGYVYETRQFSAENEDIDKWVRIEEYN
jgi:hypothetical protein